MEKYYQIMGVSKNTKPNELKKRYHELVKEYHPDKYGENEKIKEITVAYAIIKNNMSNEKEISKLREYINQAINQYYNRLKTLNIRKKWSLGFTAGSIFATTIVVTILIGNLNISIPLAFFTFLASCNTYKLYRESKYVGNVIIELNKLKTKIK